MPVPSTSAHASPVFCGSTVTTVLVGVPAGKVNPAAGAKVKVYSPGPEPVAGVLVTETLSGLALGTVSEPASVQVGGVTAGTTGVTDAGVVGVVGGHSAAVAGRVVSAGCVTTALAVSSTHAPLTPACTASW